ncbi:hypothetical protein [Intrasporangium sp.]|uniref:hypothetical protein n=1 Tax=Intrasporangium sp. TaxID=1925024 RepID=UPI00322199E9
MADPTEPATTAWQRFLINVIGLAGIVYGGLAIVYYLLGFDAISFAAAPYRWLQLEGLVRYVPPLIVFVVCFVVVWAIEQHAARRSG